MAKNFEQKGDLLAVVESTLQHLDPGDGLVDSGQPVTFGAQDADIADITDTAGGTYTAAEQTMLNNLKAAVNSVLSALRDIGAIGANGRLSGVAQIDAKASTDTISVHRRGAYRLSVTGADDVGNVAVAIGDAIYLDIASVQVNKDSVNGVLIGYALAIVTSGATTTIPVLLKDA